MKNAAASTTKLALIVGGLGMVGPFAIDSFFPAFPEMARDLLTDGAGMQATLSAYLAGFALMSIVHGPLSDGYGRRPIVLINLFLFVIASFGAAAATSITEMLWWRFVQGLAGGAGTIVGRAIIRDCLDGAAAQRLMSRITLVFLLGPALAPVIGGYIYVWFGWHAIFVFTGLFALLLGLAVQVGLPETLPVADRVSPKIGALAAGLVDVSRDRVARQLIAAAALNFAGIFLYIGGAAEISYRLLGFGPTDFGKYFWLLILGFLIGSQLSGWLAGKISARQQLQIAYATMGAGLVVNLLLHGLTDSYPWWLFVAPLTIYAIGSSMGFPVLTILLLDRFAKGRGSAASLQTFVSLSANALTTWLLLPRIFTHGLKMALAQAALLIAGLWFARDELWPKPVASAR